MSEQPVTTAKTSDVQVQPDTEVTVRPAVDIFETADSLTLRADMPGVAKERLNVHVDKDNLLIEGQVVVDIPTGMEALYSEVRTTRYRRNFSLSSELDADHIEADLKDGVLNLRIPKQAQAQPRKIEVKVA